MNKIFDIATDLNSPEAQQFAKDVDEYIHFLGEFENKISRPANKVELQSSINKRTLEIVKNGAELISALSNKKTEKKIKEAFRDAISPWMNKSVIMERGLKKPKGYPGDFQMLEYIYDNKPVSEGIGYYFDEGFLKSELTEAVRDRKNMMRKILAKELENGERVVLDLACGSSREIKELNDENKTTGHFICLDFDGEALEYSKKSLSGGGKISSEFIKDDILDIVRKGKSELFKDKDIVYSIGLVDYFPDRLFKGLLALVINSLKKGARFIFTIKDRNVYNPVREDWLTDWTFVPRNTETVAQIFRDLNFPNIDIDVTKAGSDIIVFYTVTKK